MEHTASFRGLGCRRLPNLVRLGLGRLWSAASDHTKQAERARYGPQGMEAGVGGSLSPVEGIRGA
jgi:hypothetical protein